MLTSPAARARSSISSASVRPSPVPWRWGATNSVRSRLAVGCDSWGMRAATPANDPSAPVATNASAPCSLRATPSGVKLRFICASSAAV